MAMDWVEPRFVRAVQQNRVGRTTTKLIFRQMFLHGFSNVDKAKVTSMCAILDKEISVASNVWPNVNNDGNKLNFQSLALCFFSGL